MKNIDKYWSKLFDFEKDGDLDKVKAYVKLGMTQVSLDEIVTNDHTQTTFFTSVEAREAFKAALTVVITKYRFII